MTDVTLSENSPIDPDDFIEGFLEHAKSRDKAYVKEYNRRYYLRTRKLKGRANKAQNPSAGFKKSASSMPKVKRVEEDEVPRKSPLGGKLVDYDGSGSGKAKYSDGSWYDGNGWHTTAKNQKEPWKLTGTDIAVMGKKLQRAEEEARRKNQPEVLKKISAAKKKLNKLKKQVGKKVDSVDRAVRSIGDIKTTTSVNGKVTRVEYKDGGLKNKKRRVPRGL